MVVSSFATISVTITDVPPPVFAWKNAVNGDWATAVGWTPAGPPNTANADVTIAVGGAYTVTIAAAESFLVDSLTFAPTGAAVLALNGTLTLGGTQAAMNESAVATFATTNTPSPDNSMVFRFIPAVALRWSAPIGHR